MMRRLPIAVLLAAALAPVAAGAAEPIKLTSASGARFPDRIYVLSLPKNVELRPEQVHVTENGKDVTNVQLVPAGDAGKGAFGVVLALDTSNSMRGPAIGNAVEAARSFLTYRSPNWSAAVVFFNRKTNVIQEFTHEGTELTSALESVPRLAEGTHIYDGVLESLALLKQAKVAAGSIVVLSDGSDTGSSVKLPDLTARAKAQHVRVFTIGLRSQAFSPGPLRKLASSTGGSYAVADDVNDLTAVYRSLGARLSREYLLHYRSLAVSGTTLRVKVTVDDFRGTGRSVYTAPALRLKPVAPYRRSSLDRALQSPGVAIGISALSAVLVAFGLIALLRTPGKSVRSRVGEFVSVASTVKRQRSGGIPDRVLGGAERSLERAPWWSRFAELVELAEIPMPAVQIVLWSFVGAFGLGYFLAAITGAPVMFIFGFLVPLAVYELINARVTRKRRIFADQLPDNLQVLASALRAGHSLVGAMAVVVEDAAKPTRSELRRVVADERLGVPLEDALEVVVRRMDSRELAQVALVAHLQRQTGGNAAEVLDRVTELIRERQELRRLVRTLTAQGRMSRWILTALPVALMLIIALVNPGYLDPLLHTSGGRVALVVAALMALAGSLAIRKIVNIKI